MTALRKAGSLEPPSNRAAGADAPMNYSHIHITNVYEGEFKHGLFNGFGRLFDAQGQCHVGFWKAGPRNLKDPKDKGKIEVTRPHGKWSSYRKDGAALHGEGIYMGDPMTSCNRLVALQKIKDYNQNPEPRLSLGQQMGDVFRGCGMCQAKGAKLEPGHGRYIYEL